MRSIAFSSKDYFYLLKDVAYTLKSRNRTGIEVDVIMEGVQTSTIYHPSSWRNFKKYIAYIK